jgi:hypothetical protein
MTMTDVYRNVADAPPVAPPRFSLLTAVPTVDEPGLRWEGGYSFLSEMGGRHDAVGVEGCLEWYEAGTDEAWTVDADPVVLWAEGPCHTTMGTRSRDWQAIARRSLLARQSRNLARWLADEQLTPASTANGGEAQGTPAYVIAKLEDWLALELDGPVGCLHVSPGTLAVLVGGGFVNLDGARYTTPIGTVVVADAGYAGSTGGGLTVGGTTEGAIVATGPMRVRLGPIELTDPPLIDAPTNTVKVVAWRAATVELDWGGPDDATKGPPALGGLMDLSAGAPA